MRYIGNRWVLACAAAAALAGLTGHACAQAYPSKYVKFVVTYPPGGSSDVMARIIGQELTSYWGQTVIVESKPGADGAIGMEYSAKQPADGYTLILGNFGPVVAKPLLSNVSYDWRKDFAPVSRISHGISGSTCCAGTGPVQKISGSDSCPSYCSG